MANWIKLYKGDNYIEIIKGQLSSPNSFEWFGDLTFHAWLDTGTGTGTGSTGWVAR